MRLQRGLTVKELWVPTQPMLVIKHQLSRKDRISGAQFQDVRKRDDRLAVIGNCSPASEAEFAREHLYGARFWGSAYRM